MKCLCSDVPDKECKVVLKDVTNKVCSTTIENKCEDVDQVTYELTYKDECQDVAKQVIYFYDSIVFTSLFGPYV